MGSAYSRITLLIGVLCAAAALVVGTYLVVEFRSAAPENVREKSLSGIALTLENGETLDVAQFDGTPVIIVVWATWCPSCLEALTAAASVKEQYGDRVAVIALNRTEEQRIIDDYRNAVLLPRTITYVNDSDDAFFERVSGTSMPEVVVYGGDGSLITHLIASPSAEELAAFIASAL